MILLDTNVISEMMRPRPDPAVGRWLADQPAASVFISAITEAELRYGLALLPEGKRRSALTVVMEEMLAEDFRERIIAFDSSAAVAFARIAADRRQAGRPIHSRMRRSRPRHGRAAPRWPRATWLISKAAG